MAPRRPRGPYKIWLDPKSDGIMPRSTFNKKLKMFRSKNTTQADEISLRCNHMNVDYNNPSTITDTSSTSVYQQVKNIDCEKENDMLICHPNVQMSTMNNISWLNDEYDDGTRDQEIWFDAEEFPLSEGIHADENQNFYQKQYSKSENDHYYRQPLCKCTQVSRGEALMMTLLLGAEESLTWKATTAILSMINTLFGDTVVPASKFQLFKTLNLSEDILQYHLFCDNCSFYFGVRDHLNKEELQCQSCRKVYRSATVPYFLTINMQTQLKMILEDSEVQKEFLLNRFENSVINSNSNYIESVVDGRIYKKLSTTDNPLSNSYNFSYTFNTDGCQASKSSKSSIWPIYASINELPPKLQSKHIIMTGIWVHKNEPDMKLFLKPFIDQANEISDKGIKWKLRDQTITSKFIPTCAVVDSVARCKILNMKQYNGLYGCTFCEHPTENVNGYRRFTISTVVSPDRTDSSIKKSMLLAGQNKNRKDVMGVWGPSPLMNLKYFDIADGMSPDYMHSVLLGVVKQHTNILLTSFGKEYYIGNPNQLEAINDNLLTFRPPTCITRSPRDINEREMWKASEWRSWLIFYSVICIKEILPRKYLNHLALLAEAFNILLSEKMTYDEVRTAGTLLIQYVTLYQEYFGKDSMTYNIHLLLHMERSVLNLGPLRCQNTFSFENENHFVLKMKKSPSQIGLQIARRYLFQKSLPSLQKKIEISDGFKKFCERSLTKRLRNTFTAEGCTLIGKGQEYNLNMEEQKILNRSNKCKSFNRFIFNGKRYTSDSYRLCQKINDSLIVLKNGKIGIIKNICYYDSNESDKKIYIFYEEFIMLEKYFYSTKNVTIHNIQECLVTKNLQVCEVQMILKPCFLKKIQNKNYIIFIPQGCYGD